jgi:hypothetical protein
MKLYLFCLLLICSFTHVKSQNYDELQVSLLTVESRPKAIYTLFGHTAIRLYDPSNKMDVVVNWGYFDFDKPNFILHFIKGETDYMIDADPTNVFVYVYSKDERTTVHEQLLNIPNSEKEALVKMLKTNLLPENVEYRYNYFFDNCTTRPRDIIERFCGGQLIYQNQPQALTFRNFVHQYTRNSPWAQFGIDLLIGNGADSLISYRTQLFLPETLMEALNHSVVKDAAGNQHPIVLSSKIMIQTKDSQEDKTVFAYFPLITGWTVFLISLILAILGYWGKPSADSRFLPTVARLYFILLFFCAGLGGCIVVMTSFFSVHPCTWPNLNILWIHPFQWIGCLGYAINKSYRPIRWYHATNFVLLSALLLGWHWIPQQLNVTCVPFILSLWLGSAHYFFSKKA